MTVHSRKIPEREHCVLRYALSKAAEEVGQRHFIRFGDETAITYAEFKSQVERTAAALASLGVKQGDTVTVWLPNGAEMIRVWFAANWLGATYVPINVAYRGSLLAHVIANAASKVIVASADLVPRLADIALGSLKTCIVLGGNVEPIAGLEMHYGEAALRGDPKSIPVLERPIEPWDFQAIIYTSGTTGSSKGVASPYAHHFSMSKSFYMLDKEDCSLIYLPLFHIGGTVPVIATLHNRGTLALAGEFSTDAFWSAVDSTRATFVILLGVMTKFLSKRPPDPADSHHCLKKVMMIPLEDDWREFSSRFCVDVWTMWNMTELNVPIVSAKNPTKQGTCGTMREGVEVRLVDANDCEVPEGEVGELIIRADAPWTLNAGYYNNPEATATAWRNGWFHSGDALRRDSDGDYYFVDRMKDAIRRRGENISSFEVESEILAHPSIRECAVVAIPSDASEDEVLAIVSRVPGANVDPAELIEFLKPRLAHFMIPRYIRVLDELPLTPTQKVEKHKLRLIGLTPDTWDRQSAGIRIQREVIRS